MKAHKQFFLGALFVLLILLLNSYFIIYQGQAGLVLRLGQLTQVEKSMSVHGYLPGLHFKIPLIDTLKKFDMRLQTLDIQSSRIVTAEKKDVIVDFYVKWRINDLPLYYKRTNGNIQKVNTLLSQQLNGALRAQFGRRTIKEVVSDEREQIMHALSKKAAKTASSLGIQVVDVRIKRIDLPEEVSNAVYERMRAERERVAKEHRSEGRAKAEAIRAQADAEAAVIVANANATAQGLRAEGDAGAGKIYIAAYSKDATFYNFMRSLQAYTAAFSNKNDVLLLSPQGAFFQYFNQLPQQK